MNKAFQVACALFAVASVCAADGQARIRYEARLRPGVSADSVRLHFVAWARRNQARTDRGIEAGQGGVRVILHPACRGIPFGFDAEGVCRGEVVTGELGPGYHQAVVAVLDELRDRFAAEISVRDSAGYWETRNREALVEPMLRQATSALERALGSWPDDPSARLRTPVGEFDRSAAARWLGDLRARRRLCGRFVWWEEGREGGYWTNLGCVVFFNRFLRDDPGAQAQRLADSARRHLERGRSEGCDTWLARYYLGLIEQERGRFDAAASWFIMALELEPRQPDAMLALGEARLQSNAMEAAIKDFQRAVEAYPRWAEARFRLGQVLNVAGRRSDAVQQLRRAVELAPEMGAAWVEKGLALRSQERLDAALRCHEKGTQLDPSSPNAWYSRGVTLLRLRRAAEAIASLNRCLELDPAHYDAMIELGLAQWVEGSLDEAERTFRRAATLKAARPEAFFNLGQLYDETGREAESRQMLEQARRRGMVEEDE